MLPLTMKLNSKNTRTQPQMTSHTNYQTVTLSPSRTKDSDAQSSSSSQPSLVLRFQGSTNWPSNPSWNVILMSERTFMETSLCPVVPLCSLVFQRDSAKKLLLLLPQPWKSRLLPHLKKILRLDRRIHPFITLHLLSHVDHQSRIWWIRPKHRTQKMFLI